MKTKATGKDEQPESKWMSSVVAIFSKPKESRQSLDLSENKSTSSRIESHLVCGEPSCGKLLFAE